MKTAKIILVVLLTILFLGGAVGPLYAQGPSPTPTPVTQPPQGTGDDPFTGFRKGIEDFGKTLAALKDWPTEFQKGFSKAVNETLESFFTNSADFYFGHPLPEFKDPNSFESSIIRNVYRVALFLGFPVLMLAFFYKLFTQFAKEEQNPQGLVGHIVWTVGILIFSAAPILFLGSFFGAVNAVIRDTLHGKSELLSRLDAIESLKNLLLNVFSTPSFVWFLLVGFLAFFGSKIVIRLLIATFYLILGSLSLGLVGIVSVVREPDQATVTKELQELIKYFLEFSLTYLILAFSLSLITTQYFLPVASWLLLGLLVILDQAPPRLAKRAIALINRTAPASPNDASSEFEGLPQEVDEELLPKSQRRS